MNLKAWVLVSLINFVMTNQLFAKTDITAHVGLEAGKSYPQNHLVDFLNPGDTYRFQIFGGAKVKGSAGVGAVGLGLDLSYSDFELKEGLSGHYRRFVWDWFFLPIKIGFIEITPGISWVVTDIDFKEYGIQDVSIRPGAILALGVEFNLLPHLAFTAQMRGEKVWEDHEKPTVNGAPFKELNLTGDILTATAGILAYF